VVSFLRNQMLFRRFGLLLTLLATTYAKKVFLTRPKIQQIASRLGIPISYNGGPTMNNNNSVYFIFYGNNFTTSTQNVLTKYASSIGNSNWWKIVRKYNVGSISYGGSYNYPNITNNILTSTDISSIIVNSISSNNQWPGQKNGSSDALYVLLTDNTVDQSDSSAGGFCTQYCGWHDYLVSNNVNIKYIWVGSPVRCPNACSALPALNSPNNNFEADSFINTISHELAETTSDPNLNAWYDNFGYENGDKCAWNFGKVYFSNNKIYNEKFNVTNKYYIQMMWDPMLQKCVN
jgi:hypothetical protein